MEAWLPLHVDCSPCVSAHVLPVPGNGLCACLRPAPPRVHWFIRTDKLRDLTRAIVPFPSCITSLTPQLGRSCQRSSVLWSLGTPNIISRFHILLQTPSRSLLLFTTELLGFVCLYYCLYFFFLETILVRLSISPHDQNPSCQVPQRHPHCCIPWSVFSLVLCTCLSTWPFLSNSFFRWLLGDRSVFFWTHWLLLLSRFLVSLTEVGSASVTSSQASLISYWSFRLTVLNSSPLLMSNSASHGVWTQVHPDGTLDSQPFHLSRQQNLLPGSILFSVWMTTLTWPG